MKIKDTVHFNLHKNLFVVFVILICMFTSAKITKTDFREVFNNIDQMVIFLRKMSNPDFSYLPNLINPLIKTLKMSVLGTVLGVLLAIPAAFLATTFVTENTILTMVVRFILNVIRTVPNLLLAAILVAIIGIGEFTGVITITIFTFGIVSQLLYETIETIDLAPIEACESVGANKIQVATWAVFPQIINSILSYGFYALEINVRASTVLGYVGAGGIGIILNTSLALFRYDRVSLVILVIFIIVIIVDTLSEYVRGRLS